MTHKSVVRQEQAEPEHLDAMQLPQVSHVNDHFSKNVHTEDSFSSEIRKITINTYIPKILSDERQQERIVNDGHAS